MDERQYRYVGPASILARVEGMPPGAPIRSEEDAIAWLAERHALEEIATYTVGTDGLLRLADRRSEHVACAGFLPVLAAGELSLQRRGKRVVVTSVSNQSTGYCPEASCWPAVRRALSSAGIEHPSALTAAYEFRRCLVCASIHIVKDGDLTCACGAPLPEAWNFEPPQGQST